MSHIDNGNNSIKRTILELKNISKSFPGVKALDNVSLRLNEGEVLALVGENGAGKSTLIKIITGIYTPDEGEVYLYSKKVTMANSRKAFENGINAVHQERNLINTFTVAENILMEKITRKMLSKVNIKLINEEASKYLKIVGLDVLPDQNVDSLCAGQKQMLEIARSLSSDARLIMLDEPTASISMKEAEILLDTVRKLREQGLSFIYVSHKLEEVFSIADSVCVIRDGKNAGPILATKELDRNKLITMMIGRSENTKGYPPRDMSNQHVVLEAKEISSKLCPHKCSFKLHQGEILGWYGLVGAGRTEVARQIIGFDQIIKGQLYINGKTVKIKSPKDALKKIHIAYISENRNEEGLFLIHSIKTNISSSIWQKISNRIGLLDIKKEKVTAEKYKSELEIKTPDVNQLVNNLSGGNRQKVSISKSLAVSPEILIIDEPTVGIDVKTKAEIYNIIWKLSQEGMPIIIISSDMPELIRISDRMLVFRDGYIIGELNNSKDYDTMSKKIMEYIVNRNIVLSGKKEELIQKTLEEKFLETLPKKLSDLKPEENIIEEYRRYHESVWPEVPVKLKKIGIISNKIYILGNRLVSILTVEDWFDPQNDLLKYTEDLKCKEWDELMCTFQQRVPGAKDDEWWALMEEIFSYQG